MRVSTALGTAPPFFVRDVLTGISSPFINPGHRLAVNRSNGFVYELYQVRIAPGADGVSQNINFVLNRSTDNPVEPFSADGPRKIFFNPDGSSITPGNYLFATNGGQTLLKPDLTAADGVFTKTPGFLPFFGTSASSPHAAGIAALVVQARPSYTPAQVKKAMTASALDNMAVALTSMADMALPWQAVPWPTHRPTNFSLTGAALPQPRHRASDLLLPSLSCLLRSPRTHYTDCTRAGLRPPRSNKPENIGVTHEHRPFLFRHR